jgi:glyoxylase-like metal-dependent hydrolase (beta-lactamase superfamily II)
MTLNSDLAPEPRYGVIEQVSPYIQRMLAPNPGPFTFEGTGVYILGTGASVAVIDPGPDLPQHIEALKRALDGRRVSHILITHTHNDHSPAARPLSAWSGAPTYGFGPHAENSDVEAGGDRLFVPDVRVKDGDQILGEDFTIDCVFTPGHTSNHMCYALAEEKALFTGDHVMGWSTTVIAPPDGNMGDYMRSLEKLLARDDVILYPTHGSPISDPEPFVHAYLVHRRMREAQVASSLARGADTIAAIVARLYPGLAPALLPAAALTIQAHLEHMIEEKKVARDGGAYRLIGPLSETP